MGTDSQWHLAYKANIMPENIMDNFNAYISCETGNIVFEEPLVFQANAIGTAVTRYSGAKSITTDSNNGHFRLREVSRGGTNTAIQTFNFLRNPAANVNETQTSIANAVDFTDNDNNWTANEFNNTNFDNAALDVHWATEKTFDYFRTIHGRNSYDNNNGIIKSYVHVRTRDNSNNIVNMDNAFWSNSFNSIFYGDGNWLEPLVCVDIVAHELGHAICQSTANLTYSGESGSINESLSDIWGACVENWATTDKQTWFCGEDIGTPLRSMSNPKLFNQPNTYQSPLTNGFWFEQNGCTPNQNNDYCGVHTNSGIGNFWFFLLSQGDSGTNDLGNAYRVTGIGIEKAAEIVYLAETSYLTSSANYAQFRNATISAARALYQDHSNEVIAVTEAWYAVGVGSRYHYPISGLAHFCSTGNFSIQNLPYDYSVQWTVTRTREAYGWESAPIGGKITLSQTYSTPTITLNTDNGMPEYIQMSVTIRDQNNAIVNTHNFSATSGYFSPYVGTLNWNVNDWQNPQNGETTYQSYGNTLYLTPGQTTSIDYLSYVDNAGNYFPGVEIYSYSYYRNNTTYSGNTWPSIDVPSNTSPSDWGNYLEITLQNSCGIAAHSFQIPIQVTSSYYSSVLTYPNPTSDIINIEIGNIASDPFLVSKNDKKEVLYYIQLYDKQGNLLRQNNARQGKIQFNVSDLKNDIYFLKISNNINRETDTRTIIIKH
jgi:Zn-dependent metalloprotease